MNDKVDDLVHDLVDSMPEPQEHAIEQELSDSPESQTEQSQSGTVGSGPRDTDGNSFDPELHMVDGDGNPKLTPTGKLKKKRKPRAKKSTIGIDEPISNNSSNGNPRAAATATVEAIGMAGRMISDEWAFIRSVEHGIDEKAAGIDAFSYYYESKGIGDLPPGVVVAIWAMGYAGARINAPKTSSKLKLGWAWLKSKLPGGKQVNPRAPRQRETSGTEAGRG